MNHHKFWFFIFSAFSMMYSIAATVFASLMAYFALCEQAGKSLAMFGSALLCVIGSIGYFQWADKERNRYF